MNRITIGLNWTEEPLDEIWCYVNENELHTSCLFSWNSSTVQLVMKTKDLNFPHEVNASETAISIKYLMTLNILLQLLQALIYKEMSFFVQVWHQRAGL